MRTVVYAAEAGLHPKAGVECSEKLQAFLNSNPENATLVLAPGDYYLEHRVSIEGLRNVQILGYGVRFVCHFDMCDPYAYPGCFKVKDCRDLSLCGFTLTNDNPVNTPGRVVSIDRENYVVDILLDEGFTLTGNERIFGVDSFDEDAAGPNWHVFFSDDGNGKGKGYRYKRIGQRMIRMFCWPSTGVQVLDLTPGERLCLRHGLYPTDQITFRDCYRVELTDVTVESSPGESCSIYERCADFTFRRFRVALPRGCGRLYSSNTDGIHVVGLGGRLLIEDCDFESLGDDAVNVHTTGAVIASVEGTTVHCTLGDRLGVKGGLLSERWAQSGDEIAVYEKDTFVKKGSFRVVEYTVNRLSVTDVNCELCPGDMLANMAFCPEVIMRNCRVKGTRARGVLFQTHRVLLENSYFGQISNQAVQITSDMERWAEMCPCEEVVIRGCVFESNGLTHKPVRAGGIAIGVGHGGHCYDIAHKDGVHGSIAIDGNRFVHLKDPAIFADGVQRISVTNNEFVSCCAGSEGRYPDYAFGTVLFNCKQRRYAGNSWIGQPDKAYLEKNA